MSVLSVLYMNIFHVALVVRLDVLLEVSCRVRG